MVTFVVGESAESIEVHSDAIARLSPSLNALVKGSMRESQEKSVRWDDVDPADFLRFCEFAYAGNYAPAEANGEFVKSTWWTMDVDQARSSTTSLSSKFTFESLPPLSSRGGDRMKEPVGCRELPEDAVLRQRFRTTRYHDEQKTSQLKSSQTTPVDDGWKNFAPMLLSHARLYVLGEKYGVDSLTSLTIHKLHETLKVWKLDGERVRGVMQLARYIYENTPAYSKDPMRSMVLDYIVSEISTVQKSPRFTSLLVEGGDFVADFWKLLQEHLFSS